MVSPAKRRGKCCFDMYKVTINGEMKGIYEENDLQGIAEIVIAAINKGGKKIYIEEVETNEN